MTFRSSSARPSRRWHRDQPIDVRGALSAQRRQLALPADAPRRRARSQGRADRLRRRRPRHDRARRAPAPRRGAGAPARRRIARRRRRHLDDDHRSRQHRLERADVRAVRSLRRRRPRRASVSGSPSRCMPTIASASGASRKRTSRAATGRTRSSFAPCARTAASAGSIMRADVDHDTTGPRRVLGVAMDVTAHHRALDALREASERAAFITSHAGIGTWESDAAGCGRWNAQMFHLRGLAPRETAPSREEWMALVHPDDVPLVLEGSPDAAAALLPMAYEFRVRLPDGSYRWLASRSAAVLDDAGRPARRVGVNWDVTESKNAEIARQQAALAEREIQAKSQFLSRMSHELQDAAQRRPRLHPAAPDRGAPVGPVRRSSPSSSTSAPPATTCFRSSTTCSTCRGSRPAKSASRCSRSTWHSSCAESLPLLQSLATQHGVLLEIGAAEGVAHADPTRLAPGADQPALERHQVQPARRPGRGRSADGARRGGDALGSRHRPRPERRADRQPVRAVQPLRRRERRHRGHRHRPDDRQGARRRHGRADRGREQPGPRHRLHRDAARGGDRRLARRRRRPGRDTVAAPRHAGVERSRHDPLHRGQRRQRPPRRGARRERSAV